jgi:hypothetical protein
MDHNTDTSVCFCLATLAMILVMGWGKSLSGGAKRFEFLGKYYLHEIHIFPWMQCR